MTTPAEFTPIPASAADYASADRRFRWRWLRKMAEATA
jgi:hypothetical protein